MLICFLPKEESFTVGKHSHFSMSKLLDQNVSIKHCMGTEQVLRCAVFKGNCSKLTLRMNMLENLSVDPFL
jgi:hypothetical protein